MFSLKPLVLCPKTQKVNNALIGDNTITNKGKNKKRPAEPDAFL
jgi:hypothetical protein